MKVIWNIRNSKKDESYEINKTDAYKVELLLFLKLDFKINQTQTSATCYGK